MKAVENWPGGLPNVCIGYAFREKWDKGLSLAEQDGNNGRTEIPSVIGFSTPEEVKESLKVWREVNVGGEVDKQRLEMEDKVLSEMKDSGFYGWAWESPAPSKKTQ